MDVDSPYKIDVALIHYPVVNKSGETIGSAVTNLDLHDMPGPLARTGLKPTGWFTPDPMQKELVREIVSHWNRRVRWFGKP